MRFFRLPQAFFHLVHLALALFKESLLTGQGLLGRLQLGPQIVLLFLACPQPLPRLLYRLVGSLFFLRQLPLPLFLEANPAPLLFNLIFYRQAFFPRLMNASLQPSRRFSLPPQAFFRFHPPLRSQRHLPAQSFRIRFLLRNARLQAVVFVPGVLHF